MTDWKLIEAEDIDATMDDSGLYVIVSRVEGIGPDLAGDMTQPIVRVRADLMANDLHGDVPRVSFTGTANNVRKNLVQYLQEHHGGLRHISMEHASYIGYELLRAEKEVGFKQD